MNLHFESAVSDRRQRLAECVDKLAVAIATGACTPDYAELRALAEVCEEHFLPREAARVRRWMARLESHG